MRIERANSIPTAARPHEAQPAAAASPSNGLARDAYQTRDVKVITFNTAVGNPAIKTNQADFLELPFYRKVIEGAPDAGILCLQEVGNAQRDALLAEAKSGQFTAIPMRVGLRGRQNNMLVIPKRYQVLSHENTFYKTSHLKGVWGILGRWVRSGFKQGVPGKQVGQLMEPRGFQKVELKDTVTGKTFTVFNTHTSYFRDLMVNHVHDLMAHARQAAQMGPVIVAGDLNMKTADTDTKANSYDAQGRAALEGFQDVGPTGAPPNKPNIDWVLARGFSGVSAHWYTGDSIALPGSPDAAAVSDHYAEENILRFE